MRRCTLATVLLLIANASALLGPPAPGQQTPDPPKQLPDTDEGYRKAAEIWRETTTEGVLPSDFQYLRNATGWREAVLSYMRDGPGIFNVPPDREAAMIDRAMKYIIERDGYEVVHAESVAIDALLETGDRTAIKSYAYFLRVRFAAELNYAAGRMMHDLTVRDLHPEERRFLLDALGQMESRLTRHLEERAQNPPPVQSSFDERHQQSHLKLLQQGVADIKQFLREHPPME